MNVGDLNLEEMLGATDAVSVTKLTIYLPDRDRDGRQFAEFEDWADTGLTLLALINDGATRLPAARGKWRGTGTLRNEWTTLIYSHVDNPERFQDEFYRITQFAHTFGARTNQHTVLVEWSGEAYEEDNVGELKLRYLSRAFRIQEFPEAIDEAISLEEMIVHLGDGLPISA